jgi:hypothetical protein
MSKLNWFVPPLRFWGITAVQLQLSHVSYCQIVKETLCIIVVTGSESTIATSCTNMIFAYKCVKWYPQLRPKNMVLSNQTK